MHNYGRKDYAKVKFRCIIIATKLKNKKMNISKKTMKGFSLVEVLISLAIIAIMTGTLLMTGNNKSKQEVQLAGREIAAQLRLLQNDALSGKVVGGKNICKAEMSLTAGANTYETRYYDQCSSANPIATNPFTLKKIELLHTGSISFSVPMAKIAITPLVDGFVLKSEKYPNPEMTICIKDGNIKEIKGNNIAACAS